MGRGEAEGETVGGAPWGAEGDGTDYAARWKDTRSQPVETLDGPGVGDKIGGDGDESHPRGSKKKIYVRLDD